MYDCERLEVSVPFEVLFVIFGGRVADDREDFEKELGRKGSGEGHGEMRRIGRRLSGGSGRKWTRGSGRGRAKPCRDEDMRSDVTSDRYRRNPNGEDLKKGDEKSAGIGSRGGNGMLTKLQLDR